MSESLIIPDNYLQNVLGITEEDFLNNEIKYRNAISAVVRDMQDKLNCSFTYKEAQNIRLYRNVDYRVVIEREDVFFYLTGELKDVVKVNGLTVEGSALKYTAGFQESEAFIVPLKGGFLVRKLYNFDFELSSYSFGREEGYFDNFVLDILGYGLVEPNGAVRDDIRYNLALLVGGLTGRNGIGFIDVAGNRDNQSFANAVNSAKSFFDRLYAERAGGYIVG